MSKIIKNIEKVCDEAVKNVYAVRYSKREKDNNCAVALPFNQNLVSEFCKDIITHKNKNEKAFDPLLDGLESGTYEYVPLNDIKVKWAEIESLINEPLDYYERINKEKVPQSNLYVITMDYEKHRYYFCSKQVTNSNKLLKSKTVLFSHQDNIQIVEPGNIFVISTLISFVIDQEKNKVLIFDKQAFCDVFKYDEYQKNKVRKEINKIDRWTFLSSTDLIKDKCSQRNVYRSLAKIFADENYMNQINQSTPAKLKQSLLNNCPNTFTDSDFEKDKLVVTEKNLEIVMKMLSKCFRYNFFTNNAE